MPNIFESLVGQKIQKAEMVHDYLQLSFDNGVILNIFNTFTVDRPIENFSHISGRKVHSFIVSNEAIEICIDGMLFRVGLSDDNYRGPEAMEYISAEGEHVIWQ